MIMLGAICSAVHKNINIFLFCLDRRVGIKEYKYMACKRIALCENQI